MVVWLPLWLKYEPALSTGAQIEETSECKLMLEKCILCEKGKDNRGDKKLTSTGNGRKTLEERLKSCGVGSRVNHGLNNMLTPATQS